MTEFRNIRQRPEDLTGGRVVGAREIVDLSDDDVKDPYNKAKIDEGVFVKVVEPKGDPPPKPDRDELLAKAKELEITGASRMNNDQLLTAVLEAEEKRKETNT